MFKPGQLVLDRDDEPWRVVEMLAPQNINTVLGEITMEMTRVTNGIKTLDVPAWTLDLAEVRNPQRAMCVVA